MKLVVSNRVKLQLLFGLQVCLIATVLLTSTEVFFQPVANATAIKPVGPPKTALRGHPEFNGLPISDNVRQLVTWVAHGKDNGENGFIVLDKSRAQLYVFDTHARLVASSPVLIGAAPGDDSVPGIGDRPLKEVLWKERTTPAGRFLGERGRNLSGEDVIWVDYDAGLSMHRVRTTHLSERRLERLQSQTPQDNRISYGCVNVPTQFYDTHVRPLFSSMKALIYILPETKQLAQVFASQRESAHFKGGLPLSSVGSR